MLRQLKIGFESKIQTRASSACSHRAPSGGALKEAERRLLQGHEIGFVKFEDWVSTIKRAWNEAVEKVLGHEASLTS